MKKEMLTIAAAALVCSRFKVKRAFAWSADVHRHIVADALKLLEQEKKLRKRLLETEGK